MKKEIVQTWQFNKSPKEVWNYLTKPELLELWLMKADFKPVVGHKFQFECTQVINCEVLIANPFTLLSYSWQTPSLASHKLFNSTVTWTLIPNANGTELKLLHNGFIAVEDHEAHADGWMVKVGQMHELINNLVNANTNS